MVIDIISGVFIGLGVGAGLGALSALLGWAASNEIFEGKKFAIGLATGAIAGITLIASNLVNIKTALADPSGFAFVELMLLTGLSIIGTDLIRAKVAAMIANRQSEPTTTTTALKA